MKFFIIIFMILATAVQPLTEILEETAAVEETESCVLTEYQKKMIIKAVTPLIGSDSEIRTEDFDDQKLAFLLDDFLAHELDSTTDNHILDKEERDETGRRVLSKTEVLKLMEDMYGKPIGPAVTDDPVFEISGDHIRVRLIVWDSWAVIDLLDYTADGDMLTVDFSYVIEYNMLSDRPGGRAAATFRKNEESSFGYTLETLKPN